LIQQLKS